MVFRILALGGGGTKGFLHIGALYELEARYGDLKHFKDIYGCSIGSVIATGIAFGMKASQLERVSKECMAISGVFDKPSLEMFEKKGVFEMDKFESIIVKAFKGEGIDLKDKYLDDGLIPLHIIASNVSLGIPTIFQKKVPILLALRASCCIPIVFRPQRVGRHLYIDGGFMTNVLFKVIPTELHSETLAISLIHSNPHITPENVNSMSGIDYVYNLYKNACLYEHLLNKHQNILSLYSQTKSGFEDPSTEQQEEMIETGKKLTRAFFRPA